MRWHPGFDRSDQHKLEGSHSRKDGRRAVKHDSDLPSPSFSANKKDAECYRKTQSDQSLWETGKSIRIDVHQNHDNRNTDRREDNIDHDPLPSLGVCH